MSTSEAPDQGQAGGSRSTTTKTDLNLTRSSSVDGDLVRRADRAVRAALREGVTGPEVEELLSWVAQQRVLLRRRAARTAVDVALSAIRSREAA